MTRRATMDPLLVFPNPPPPELAQCLDLDGWSWKAVDNAEAAMAEEPDEGWSGAVVVADSDPEGAFALCRRLRKVEVPIQPLLVLVGGSRRPRLLRVGRGGPPDRGALALIQMAD